MTGWTLYFSVRSSLDVIDFAMWWNIITEFEHKSLQFTSVRVISLFLVCVLHIFYEQFD